VGVCRIGRRICRQEGIGQRVRILHSDFFILCFFFFLWVLVESSSPFPLRDEDFPVHHGLFFFFLLVML